MFGITGPQLSDPNAGLKKDSGADVAWTVDGGDIAFQVTEYHSDRGLAPGQRASRLRQVEKAKAASGRPYTMAGRLDPIPGIVSSVTEKVARAAHADRQRFPELILLIASSLPHDGAVATFLWDVALEANLPRLNAAAHELLSRSAFDSAYILNVLSLDGAPAVYQWDREDGWRRLGPAPSNNGDGQPTEAESSGLQAIRLLQALGGPEPAPGSLSDGLGANFFPELLEASRDRDLTLDEIKAFERSFRKRHGL
jgi:hypothetical protein